MWLVALARANIPVKSKECVGCVSFSGLNQFSTRHSATWVYQFSALLPHSSGVHPDRLARRCSRDRTAQTFTSNPPKIQRPPATSTHHCRLLPPASLRLHVSLIMVLSPAHCLPCLAHLGKHPPARIDLFITLIGAKKRLLFMHVACLTRVYRRRHEREQV